jgi:hypothetical protein
VPLALVWGQKWWSTNLFIYLFIWHKSKKSIAAKNKQTEEPGGQWSTDLRIKVLLGQ